MEETLLREYLIGSEISLVVTRNRFDYSQDIYPLYFNVLKEIYKPFYGNENIDFIIWLPK